MLKAHGRRRKRPAVALADQTPNESPNPRCAAGYLSEYGEASSWVMRGPGGGCRTRLPYVASGGSCQFALGREGRGGGGGGGGIGTKQWARADTPFKEGGRLVVVSCPSPRPRHARAPSTRLRLRLLHAGVLLTGPVAAAPLYKPGVISKIVLYTHRLNTPGVKKALEGSRRLTSALARVWYSSRCGPLRGVGLTGGGVAVRKSLLLEGSSRLRVLRGAT
jgi:hypothetical protein